MPVLLSWLRRVRRTIWICIASGVLALLWSVVLGGASLLPALYAAPSLLVGGLAFVWWHWIRPRRFQRRRGPADLRLRRLPPGSLRPLAGAIVVACVACDAFYILHLNILAVPAENPFEDVAVQLGEPWGWMPVFLMIVVLAPVFEETIFRGWIQRPLERLWGPAPAVVLSAILFSLVHFIPEFMPYYFAMGLLLGGAVLLTRSLWAPVLLHAVFNAHSLAIWVLSSGDYASEIAIAQQTPVVIVSGVLLLGSGIFLAGSVRRLRALARPARPVQVPSAVVSEIV